MFYVEPQYMTPKRKNGRVYEWEYENNDIGADSRSFKPESVFHVFYNRKNSDVFGTPWILPAMDDVRMLRRLEEFVQMLISKHLFPIYQYKVGTKEHPAIEFDGGTSEVQFVQSQIQDLPQQGCVFTSHRHEIIAVDSREGLDISKYIEHFESRALSSLGLSEVDLGRGDCYDHETETLTDSGWKKFWDVDIERDYIATMNPSTKLMEFHHPNYEYKDEYEGDMITFKGNHVDIKVTPLHDMWVCFDKKALNWEKVKAAELYTKAQTHTGEFYVTDVAPSQHWYPITPEYILPGCPYQESYKNNTKYKGSVKLSTIDFAELIGWIITDGYVSKIANKFNLVISQSKHKAEHLASLEDLISRLPFNVKKEEKSTRSDVVFTFQDKRLHSWIASNVGTDTLTKRIPRQFIESQPEVARSLLKGLLLGGGLEDKKETTSTLHTVSKDLADDLQELALRLGMSAKISIAKQSDNSYGSTDMLRIQIAAGSVFRHVSYSGVSKEYYEGVIYCFNVDNHLFFTRRNGKVAVQGNTANRGTAQVMNQTRVDRCTRIQRVLTEYFNDFIIFSLLLELGKDPFDPENEVTLKFNAINTEEKRARENHSQQLFQNDGIDHDEYRKDLNRKPFTEDQWEKSYSNTTKLISESRTSQASSDLEKQKAVTKQKTTPANQTNKNGKTKPTSSKND